MTSTSKITVFTQCLVIAALCGVLWLGLLPALLSGFFVYFILEFGSRHLRRIGVIPTTGKMILLLFIAMIVLASLALGTLSAVSFFSEGQESLVVLLQRIADIVGAAKNYLPEWALDYLPTNVEEWQNAISEWLRNNAGRLSLFGRGIGMLLIHILFGMIIGGLIAVSPPQQSRGLLARSLVERISLLGKAFRQVIFSQFKISALNTVLTALFLSIVLPLMGSPLPFVKTIIVLTFIGGMLPVIGNLLSNSVIFLIALSVSPTAVIAAVIFLIVIHKLEYFFNAKIIGSQINARAWEILLAMLVMESAFGLTGLVAAPIYYAYIKDELVKQKLI